MTSRWRGEQEESQRQEDRAEPRFTPGVTTQDNRNILNEEQAPSEFDWASLVQSTLVREMAAYADATGTSRDVMAMIYGRFAPSLYDAINMQLFANANQVRQKVATSGYVPSTGIQAMGHEYYMATEQGIQEMLNFARMWMSAKTGIDLTRFQNIGGGGGGRGRGGPTAAEIRNQFDLDEMTNAINDMSRGLVFQEHKNPRKLARDYVEAIVKTRGEKKIDFQTYVRKNIEATSRFKSIYSTKPESVTAEQYMAPYFQTAMALAPPDEAADLAIGGAQFGATAEQFQARLQRTNAVTGSAPFINGLEERMRALNSVLKG